jgi:2-haloacid dehalogenase
MSLGLTEKEVLTFDCYGTLIDWETGIFQAFQPVFEEQGLSIHEEDLLERYGKEEALAEAGSYQPYTKILATAMQGVCSQFQITPSQEAVDRFVQSIGNWPVFSDTPEALKALKQRFKLVIVSNIDDDLFALSQAKLGVTFDEVITAQQVKSYKPGLAHFQAVLQRINLPVDRILHVAQSLFHDHVPAKQMGFQTVWVNRRHGKLGPGATPLAQAIPDLEVPDLKTLVDHLSG